MRTFRLVLSLWSLLSLSAPGFAQSEPCKIHAPTPAEFVDNIGHGLSFVGTVIGFRMNDTTLTEKSPTCPIRGAQGASVECSEFWSRVVSIQFYVEAAIGSGIESDRKYEALLVTLQCPHFEIGERWLYNGSESVQLAEMPSEEVMKILRRQADD